MGPSLTVTDLDLLGLDFSFRVSKATAETCGDGAVLVLAWKVNHFNKDYRKAGKTWTMPRLDAQEQAFAYARLAFEADGRSVFNTSRHTKLEVFPCVEIEDDF